MAIQQTVVFTKAEGSFSDLAEMQTAILADLVDSTQKSALDTARSSEEFTVVSDFDPIAQQMTLVRTWNEDAFNAYKAAHPGTANSSSLESAGWDVTESIATV
jgi:hypothetical protein